MSLITISCKTSYFGFTLVARIMNNELILCAGEDSFVYEKVYHILGMEMFYLRELIAYDKGRFSRVTKPRSTYRTVVLVIPAVSWRLGDRLLPSHNQTSAPEEGEPQEGRVRSLAWLQLEAEGVTRAQAGERLQCVVTHPAYSDQGEHTAVAALDIHYAPSAVISSVTSEVLEHNVGSLSLTCTADSNPPAQIMWLEANSGEVVQYGPQLHFTPVLRKH